MKQLLIAGYGDIARRTMRGLGSRIEVRILSRSRGMDLDRPESLTSLGPADAVLHCAPPAQTGEIDTRTTNLLAALERRRILPTRLVYVGTSGVYGDRGGALVDESRAVNPQSARARRRALEEDAPEGVYNASDDTQLQMGEWFDLVADRAGLPRPPRVARSEAAGRLPAELLSFMIESRRLDNTRLKRRLGVRLRFPTVREGLEHDHAVGVD